MKIRLPNLLHLILNAFRGMLWRFLPVPIQVWNNPNPSPSLLNSVHFQRGKNLFCLTLTGNNQVGIYQLDSKGYPQNIQTLENPTAELHWPQNALITSSGENLIVINFFNRTYTFYRRESTGMFSAAPIASLPFPDEVAQFRPHGMALTDNDRYLAVAYGSSRVDPRGVALYRLRDLGSPSVSLEPVDLLQGDELPGIPKGICFTPDQNALTVAFVENHCLVTYPLDWERTVLIRKPIQILSGDKCGLSRPEDIHFHPNRTLCAVSNSDINTVTLYRFDDKRNHLDPLPIRTLKNPWSQLQFPHGLNFTPDGEHLVVSQFGPIQIHSDGSIGFGRGRRADKVLVYKI